jgi:hypothetical protein
LTEPEVRRLMLVIVWPVMSDAERALTWSVWRRHHQAVARRCHYRAREPTASPRNRSKNNRGVKAQL